MFAHQSGEGDEARQARGGDPVFRRSVQRLKNSLTCGINRCRCLRTVDGRSSLLCSAGNEISVNSVG
jgi:hypothetical protein